MSIQIPLINPNLAPVLPPPPPVSLCSQLVDILERVAAVAKYVFVAAVTILICALTMCVVPFAVGCLLGLAFSESMRAMIQRIKDFMREHPIWTTLIIIAGIALALPLMLITGAFLLGANAGSFAGGHLKALIYRN